MNANSKIFHATLTDDLLFCSFSKAFASVQKNWFALRCSVNLLSSFVLIWILVMKNGVLYRTAKYIWAFRWHCFGKSIALLLLLLFLVLIFWLISFIFIRSFHECRVFRDTQKHCCYCFVFWIWPYFQRNNKGWRLCSLAQYVCVFVLL